MLQTSSQYNNTLPNKVIHDGGEDTQSDSDAITIGGSYLMGTNFVNFAYS